MTTRPVSLGPLLFALSCGTAQPEPEFAPLPPQPPPAVAAPAKPGPPKGSLYRADVNALLDQGFARFLQRVEVEPSLEGGRFKGWTIVALRPAEWWAPVDLKPGDVVVSVNGMSIERETEAFAAFEALRAAERLTVSYLRNRQPRTLEYSIIE